MPDCNRLRQTAKECDTLHHAATHLRRCLQLLRDAKILRLLLFRWLRPGPVCRESVCVSVGNTESVCVCESETERERELNSPFNTLQHTATHCNTLQPTASHCSTLQRTATHCYTSSVSKRARGSKSVLLRMLKRDATSGGEVGGWGRDPFSRNLMGPAPRRKWYLTTGRRFH